MALILAMERFKQVEIMDCEVKRLKRSRIPLVKVRWNSRRGPEFTWEREDQFRKKYPHLFTKTAPSNDPKPIFRYDLFWGCYINSIFYDDDDDEESTIPLNEIISQITPSIVITPVLPTIKPEDSLIMGDEHFSTILEKESDEVIKSSVEDLVPIPSESKDTSDNDNFTSSDDESLSDEDVPEDMVKIYSNPLFKFDDEYISSDVNPLFYEVLENIESEESYVSNLDEPAFLVTPLLDANKDECFDPGGDIDEIEACLTSDSIPPDFIFASHKIGIKSQVMSSDSAVTYTSVHSKARSWSISSEDPYEEAARQLLEQEPRPSEYVPDPMELEDHVPVYIPEHEHLEDLVPVEDEAPIGPYITEVASAPTPPLPPPSLLPTLI
ncbi:hypothetical protein Tco_1111284 [Tanacetum coccineum]|uniref:Reverse transcriptase domain-containing protein n=1 Tax=Tanacetum coccineum TaxID=301880 RepID=A0ABQ5ILM6_9ASTR